MPAPTFTQRGTSMSAVTRGAAGAFAAAVLAAGAVAVTPAASAVTVSGTPQVAWTGRNVHVSPDGSKAFILGKYRCDGGQEGTHLWAAVKQGNITPEDPSSETPGNVITGWYDTNWNFSEANPAGLTVDCDGHWHATRFVVKNVTGTLTDGPAVVQFCLFDNHDGFAFDYSWADVRVP